ncbi:MAG: ABC transporter permease [Candidatus Methanospirareceae archaeon]
MKEGRKKRIENVIGILLFFSLWQLIPSLGLANPDFFPPFSDVIIKVYNEAVKGTLQAALIESFIHYGIGLGTALSTAIPLGIAMGRSKRVENLLYPLEEMLRPIPPIAWIPIAIVWLGFTPQAAGFIIFIGAFFPTLINTYDGVKGVDKINIEVARVLGVKSELAMIRKVILPAASPNIYTGIRISNAAGWMCLVAAEMFGAGGGMGLELTLSRNYMDMARIFAYMLVLGIIGLTMDIMFREYEARVLRWRR